ncbi:glycosyltransferase family 4 protein [Myxococcota bacterium]|nr:glycosyltransferase family 4 protein [Myxococcota bacterium]
MKILHGRGVQGRVGGIENDLFALAASEAGASHQPVFALARRGAVPCAIPDHARGLGFETHAFDMTSVWNPLAYAAWTRISVAAKADVVHLHDPRSLLLRGTTAALQRRPALMTAYGWDPAADPKASELNRRFLSGLRRVVVGSGAEADALSSFLGGRVGVEVIAPGVDATRFRPDAPTGALRKDMRIPQGVPVVGFVARLNGDRQPGDFLRAAVRVQAKHPDAFYCLVGDGRLRAYLDAMEPARALGPKIRFAGHRDDMEQVYPEMAALLVTWSPRATPRVVLEAMAAGVPVVGPRVPAMVQAIEDGVSGVLVKEGNFQLMALRAAELLSDPARAREMGAAARRRVEASFGSAARGRAYLDLYGAL